MGKSSRNALQ